MFLHPGSPPDLLRCALAVHTLGKALSQHPYCQTVNPLRPQAVSPASYKIHRTKGTCVLMLMKEE